ncbi:MAG: hypothetical protein Tsb002_35110 [Wenzhouxiangellaceae bacterium]
MLTLSLYAGVAVALLLTLWIRRQPLARQFDIAALGLIIAALIYLAFGLISPHDSQWLGEFAGFMLFSVIAAAGWRWRPAIIAYGWLTHAAWDTALHLSGPGWYAPPGYAMLCVGFDLVIGAYLLGLLQVQTATDH